MRYASNRNVVCQICNYGRRRQPLYFTAVIFLFRQHRWKTSHGISTKLGCRSEVVSICKYPPLTKKIGALPKKLGSKKVKFSTTFFATSALDTAYLRNETSHRQSKYWCQFTICPLQVDLLFVTFDPETAEIRWLTETHPWKFSIFQLLSREVCYKLSMCENIQQQSCSYIIPPSNGT